MRIVPFFSHNAKDPLKVREDIRNYFESSIQRSCGSSSKVEINWSVHDYFDKSTFALNYIVYSF